MLPAKVFATNKKSIFDFHQGAKMSSTDPTILLNANNGNLASILSEDSSIFQFQGYATTDIFAVDNNAKTKPINQPANFGGQDTFRINKRGGRVHKMWLEIQITAATLAAATRAAYVNDLGAAIIESIAAVYASKTIHEWKGEACKAHARLMYHDVSREAYNAMSFAGLPPGIGGGEAQREALVTAAFTLFVPLDWFWFTQHEDYALTPEALASELEIVVNYRRLEQLVYARDTGTGLTQAIPFAVAPTISQARLCTQLIFEPHIQKARNLAGFEEQDGRLFKIADWEEQLRQPILASADPSTVYSVKLNNIRLDSQMLMFYLRSQAVDTPYAVDRMESDPTPTILTGGGSVAAMTPIISFRLLANGSTLVDTTTDLENRAIWRKHYWPGSQIGEPIYFIPFSWILRDLRNVTGFQNMANLGNVELEITVAAHPASYLEVRSVSHNAITQKKGDIVKILR